MTQLYPTRSVRQAALWLVLAALAPAAIAQHGGGAPGGGAPGGGGGYGGGMGSQPMGGERGGMTPAQSSGPTFGGNAAPNNGIRGGLTAPAIHSAPASSIPSRFWNDSGVAKALRLRPDQQHRMDAIFDANRPTLQSLFTNLQREEANLSAISPKNTADQTKVFSAIDRVSQARSELEKEKSQLAQAIRAELTPEQLQQLDQMRAH